MTILMICLDVAALLFFIAVAIIGTGKTDTWIVVIWILSCILKDVSIHQLVNCSRIKTKRKLKELEKQYRHT